jgi:hypothetical protein
VIVQVPTIGTPSKKIGTNMDLLQNRINRLADERHAVLIETSEVYFIQDLQIVNDDVYVVTPTRIFKDTDILTLQEYASAQSALRTLTKYGIG